MKSNVLNKFQKTNPLFLDKLSSLFQKKPISNKKKIKTNSETETETEI